MPYARIRHAETRPLNLYYEVRGEGPPLILIRGFTRSLRFWGPFLEELEEDYKVILFDNRGVGRSDAPIGAYSIRQMALDTTALMDVMNLERAYVFGMSMGGMIAQELALLNRHRVLRMVLGATTPGGKHAVRLPKDMVLKLAHSATLPVREALEVSAKMTLSPSYFQQHPEVVDQWVTLQEADPRRKRGALGQAAAVLRHDTWDRLPHLKTPTLVLTGDADLLIPPENSRLLAERIPQAKLRIMKGVGHDLTTEAPAKSAAYVSDFFERG